MADNEKLEWCFAVHNHAGLAEVRIRSNGDVVWTCGQAQWLCLDGISFPTSDARLVEIVRNDIIQIDLTCSSPAAESVAFVPTVRPSSDKEILTSTASRIRGDGHTQACGPTTPPITTGLYWLLTGESCLKMRWRRSGLKDSSILEMFCTLPLTILQACSRS
jgi:hypothetical protein